MHNGNNKSKIRSFSWRDLLLIQRLQERGQVLDFERAHVDGIYPLRDAVQSYLLFGMGSRHTLVLSGNAFAQMVCHKDSRRVRLTYLAPAPSRTDNLDLVVEMLEQLVTAVGRQDIHHIVTEAQHNGPELEPMKRAGFGIFTRQMLFRLPVDRLPDGELPPLPGLRPWRSTDDWGVRLLYANTVPQIAQQIEAPVDDVLNPSLWSSRLVLEQKGEILAYLAVRQGRIGHAIRLLLHPEADIHAAVLVRHGVAKLAEASPLAVYCRVRRYESWLRAPLEASGFELASRTVLLVKHTVARVMTPAWNQIAMESQAKLTTPATHARLEDL
jgi:hypothetical protein